MLIDICLLTICLLIAIRMFCGSAQRQLQVPGGTECTRRETIIIETHRVMACRDSVAVAAHTGRCVQKATSTELDPTTKKSDRPSTDTALGPGEHKMKKKKKQATAHSTIRAEQTVQRWKFIFIQFIACLTYNGYAKQTSYIESVLSCLPIVDI